MTILPIFLLESVTTDTPASDLAIDLNTGAVVAAPSEAEAVHTRAEAALAKVAARKAAREANGGEVQVQKVPAGLTGRQVRAKAAREAKAAATPATVPAVEAPTTKSVTVTDTPVISADDRKAAAKALFAASTPEENRARLIGVLTRESGADLRSIQEAGFWISAQAALKIAKAAGYETSQSETRPFRYYAKKA